MWQRLKTEGSPDGELVNELAGLNMLLQDWEQLCEVVWGACSPTRAERQGGEGAFSRNLRGGSMVSLTALHAWQQAATVHRMLVRGTRSF